MGSKANPSYVPPLFAPIAIMSVCPRNRRAPNTQTIKSVRQGREGESCPKPRRLQFKSRRSEFASLPLCLNHLIPGQRCLSESRRLGSPQDSAVLRSSLFGGPPLDLRGLHCRAVNP